MSYLGPAAPVHVGADGVVGPRPTHIQVGPVPRLNQTDEVSTFSLRERERERERETKRHRKSIRERERERHRDRERGRERAGRDLAGLGNNRRNPIGFLAINKIKHFDLEHAL